jgi:hypothetical protein
LAVRFLRGKGTIFRNRSFGILAGIRSFGIPAETYHIGIPAEHIHTMSVKVSQVFRKYFASGSQVVGK